MTKIKFWLLPGLFLLASRWATADELCHHLFLAHNDPALARIEYTLGIVRPEAMPYLARIENYIQRAGLKMELSALWQPRSLEEKHFVLSTFYRPLYGQPSYPLVIDDMMKGEVQILVLSGPQAVRRFKAIVGHPDPYFAEKGTLRQAYGIDAIANGLHRSEDIYAAAREVRFFMDRLPNTDTALLREKVEQFAEDIKAEEFTLGLIKPEAVAAGNAGKIMQLIEEHGLQIVGAKMVQLKKSEAEGFYQEHFGKPFFADLVSYMTSGPIYVLFIKGPQAVKRYREVLGKTDPTQAAEGTIRKLYGTSKSFNAGHGSDSVNSAIRELNFFAPFFNTTEELAAVAQFKVYASHVLAMEYAVALITPDALIGTSIESVRHRIEENDIEVAAIQKFQLKPWMLEKLYTMEKLSPSFAGLVNFMAEREVYLLILRAPEVVARFNSILGDARPGMAAPQTLRNLIRSEVKYPQVIYGSPTVVQGQKDVAFVLGQMNSAENRSLQRDFGAYQARHGIVSP